MVAESDYDFRAEMHDLLQSHGYDVFACGDTHRVLNMLHNAAQLDVIVCDLQMPDVGGLAVALYAHFTYRAMPIILTSKKLPHPGLRTLIADKGWELVQKPCDAQELLTTVQRNSDSLDHQRTQ